MLNLSRAQLCLRILPLIAATAFSSCQHRAETAKLQSMPMKASAPAAEIKQVQYGVASIYLDHRTASGERYSRRAMAAAHKTWPMGTRVRVTHLKTKRSTIVRINDRGPYVRGRVIDLTPAAASAIGLTSSQGITKVSWNA
jgi:rare lipoprotein A